MAAFYAGTGVRAGEPVILRRTGNAGALMRRHVATMEVTVDPRADPDAVEVDTTDPVEIAELAAVTEKSIADVLAMRDGILAISDAELLAGYGER